MDGEYLTPIERASALRHAGVIGSLLRHHVDVNQTLRPCQGFGGALNYAVGKRSPRYDRVDPEIFRTLLQAGGDLSHGHLSYVIDKRDSDLVSLIISKNARKNITKWSEWGVFHKTLWILEEQALIDVINIMINVDADLDYPYIAGRQYSTPSRVIDVAAERGSLEMVKVLLNNRPSLSGDTLTYAARSRKEDLIHFLLERGADINSIGSQGMTAFEEAIRFRNDRVISLLEERGAFVDFKNPQHASAALMAASEAGDVAFIEYLLQLKCQTSPDDLGRALNQAITGGLEEVAMVLLDAGAKSNSSLVYAVESCSPAFVFALLDAGADPASSDEHNASSLIQIATEEGDRSVVEALLFAGANVNDISHFEKNPDVRQR